MMMTMMMRGMKDDHQGIPGLAEPKKMLRIFRLLEEVIDGRHFELEMKSVGIWKE